MLLRLVELEMMHNDAFNERMPQCSTRPPGCSLSDDVLLDTGTSSCSTSLSHQTSGFEPYSPATYHDIVNLELAMD